MGSNKDAQYPDQIVAVVSAELREQLEGARFATGVSRSEIIRRALAAGLPTAVKSLAAEKTKAERAAAKLSAAAAKTRKATAA